VAIPGTKIEVFVKESYQSYLASLSSQDQYIKNYATNSYGGSPYGRLVEMGKLAQKDGVIKGFLLHQGESNPNDAQWVKKVKSIYDNFLTEFNLKASETPLLAGELLYTNMGGACGGFNTIIDTLHKVIPNAHTISADGLTGVDQFHFTSASYRTFGKRFADTMLTILRKQATGVDKKVTMQFNAASKNIVDMKVIGSSVIVKLAERTNVSLKAFTLEGREIATIASRNLDAGNHSFAFKQDALLSAGAFVLKLNAGNVGVSRLVASGAQ